MKKILLALVLVGAWHLSANVAEAGHGYRDVNVRCSGLFWENYQYIRISWSVKGQSGVNRTYDVSFDAGRIGSTNTQMQGSMNSNGTGQVHRNRAQFNHYYDSWGRLWGRASLNRRWVTVRCYNRS